MAHKEPLYTKIVVSIEEQIRNGTLKHAERLQNERWLCETYGVSRTTLHKAIDKLVEMGLVERSSNKGVFVTYSKFDTMFDHPFSIFQELQRAGLSPTSKILSFTRVRPSPELVKILRCQPKDQLLEIQRLRLADGIPFSVQTLYLPENLFPKLNPWLLTDHSLNEVVETEYGFKIAKSEQVINTCSANKQQAELLRTTVRTPLLISNSKVTAQSGEILYYQVSWILTSVVPYSYVFKWK